MLTAILNILNFIATYNKVKEDFKTSGVFRKLLILFGVLTLGMLSLGSLYLAVQLFKFSPNTPSIFAVILVKIFAYIGGIIFCGASVVITLQTATYFFAILLGALSSLSHKDKNIKTGRVFNIFMVIFVMLLIILYIIGIIYFVQWLM